jgi:tRNA isopentenyl-2-thiomethyl-A-37 hydroxylase MiaE
MDFIARKIDGEMYVSLDQVNRAIEEKNAEIENIKASHYADSVDAGMRERRLQRALYKACANWALTEIECEQLDSQMFAFGMTSDKEVAWKKIERKFLKKAEEYR